jgi:hypothetical protein
MLVVKTGIFLFLCTGQKCYYSASVASHTFTFCKSTQQTSNIILLSEMGKWGQADYT